MVPECLDNGTEVVVAQGHYPFIPAVHFLHGFCRRDFRVEYAAKFHCEEVGGFQYRIVLEQNVCAMSLYVGPFVLRHHQGVLAAGKYLAHGLAV